MKEIMDQEQISRTLKRMTHEIIERNSDLNQIVLLGIKEKGIPMAYMLADNLWRFSDVKVPVFELDITKYRDDHKKNDDYNQITTIDLNGKNVIIVDDVLYTGRTARAAMDAITDMGRPSKIQLAILVDRGHRELPIRADYIGKNIPTSYQEKVIVDWNKNVSII